jgi:hypothetical protein
MNITPGRPIAPDSELLLRCEQPRRGRRPRSGSVCIDLAPRYRTTDDLIPDLDRIFRNAARHFRNIERLHGNCRVDVRVVAIMRKK